MASNFSPCKGSYVLNKFPSNVMFGMNGFQVSASGAIQGHHGPLVILSYTASIINQINFFTSKFECYFLSFKYIFSVKSKYKMNMIWYEMVISWYEMTNPMVQNDQSYYTK